MIDNNTKSITLSDSPQIFRYVLSLLRHRELYFYNKDLINLLTKYKIEYIVGSAKKQSNQVVMNYVPFTPDMTDNNASPTHINYVNTDSDIRFDTNLVFDIKTVGNYNTIIDIVVCIDLPVSENGRAYVDSLEYLIIEKANIIPADSSYEPLEISGHALFMKSILDWNSDRSIYNKVVDIFYDGDFITVRRLSIPLFKFNNGYLLKKNPANKKNTILSIKIAPLSKILYNCQTDIPLLNVSLIIMYGEVRPLMKNSIPKNIHRFAESYVLELVDIQDSINDNFDEAVFHLREHKYIKCFYFVIVTKSNHDNGSIDKFENDLIQLDIVRTSNGSIHGRFDSFLLNKYIPSKKLGHFLPTGVYYYHFGLDEVSTRDEVPTRDGVPTRDEVPTQCTDYSLYFRVRKNNSLLKIFITKLLPS